MVCSQHSSRGADGELNVVFYRTNVVQVVLLYVLHILTLGLSWLLCRYLPSLKLKLTATQVTRADADTTVLSCSACGAQLVQPIMLQLNSCPEEFFHLSRDRVQLHSLLSCRRQAESQDIAASPFDDTAFSPVIGNQSWGYYKWCVKTQDWVCAMKEAPHIPPNNHSLYMSNEQTIGAADDDDRITIAGYDPIQWKVRLFHLLSVLSLGILPLVFYWKPEWRLRLTHVAAALTRAHRVLVQDQYKRLHVLDVEYLSATGLQVVECSVRNSGAVFLSVRTDPGVSRYFTFMKLKFPWNCETQQFEKYSGLLGTKPTVGFFVSAPGQSEEDQRKVRVLAGSNVLKVHVTPILVILLREVLSPFYIFQIFSCILWYSDYYENYATVILLSSLLSITWSIYLTRKNERALRSTIQKQQPVTLLRPDGEVEVMPELLVPGDVIIIPKGGGMMQCDAVLITGNCVVNEAMLTGESMPVTKTAIANSDGVDNMFGVKAFERNILFSGTNVIQTKYYAGLPVKAVVLNTGFLTAKGELTRSIMFPRPLDFHFVVDSMKFIGIMGIIAFFGFIYSVWIKIQSGEDPWIIVRRCLDLITICVPPVLPIAMTIGYAMAQTRLKSQGVFCISPSRISICGVVDLICFDKTGTLTEDGLDLSCVLASRDGSFQQVEPQRLEIGPLLHALASCHSLALIDDELAGDPMDVKMFEATGWVLEDSSGDSHYEALAPTIVHPPVHSSTPPVPSASALSLNSDSSIMPHQVGILKQFAFSSTLQRMSVVYSVLGEDQFAVALKGAPEKVVSLCDPATVPADFEDTLIGYTRQGYRVLALAWRPLAENYHNVLRLDRTVVEFNLKFLGLMVMENRLKPETTPVICELRKAHLRTVMITGDNLLTAISVARDSCIVGQHDRVILVTATPPIDGVKSPTVTFTTPDSEVLPGNRPQRSGSKSTDAEVEYETLSSEYHFALTGTTWNVLRESGTSLLEKIIARGTVFARFTPAQKKQLVESFQEMDYFVAMCGDGANDCGALKAAHAGIALSETEASVASPFTSTTPNVSCIPTVIKEGRAALVTSFGLFRFIISYSVIQLVSVLLLYWIQANLTDYEYLYIDLFILISIDFTFAYTKAFKTISPKAPVSKLFAVQPVLSLLVHTFVNAAFQIGVYIYVREENFHIPLAKDPVDDEDYFSYENYTVFCISIFQYVNMAIVMSKGPPYRARMYTNWLFLGNILILTLLNCLILLVPPEFLLSLLEILLPPVFSFRICILGICITNFFVCYLLESLFIDGAWLRRWTEKRQLSNQPRHAQILANLRDLPDWPPMDAPLPLTPPNSPVAPVHNDDVSICLDEFRVDKESKPIFDDKNYFRSEENF